MKFISWNIDSINAALTSTSARSELSRNVLEMIKQEDADIIAIQETKLPEAGLTDKQREILLSYFPNYKIELVSSAFSAKKSYAGTMVLYKNSYEAKVSKPSIGAPDTMDLEGRLLCLEFKYFYFVNVYTPNAGDGLKRLKERQEWDKCYANYLTSLDKKSLLLLVGTLMLLMRKLILLIQTLTTHQRALPMRKEKDFQIFFPKALWIALDI